MAEHLWTILCEKTLIDPDSGIITLVDVAEQFNITYEDEAIEEKLATAKSLGQKGVYVPVHLQLISAWWRTETEHSSTVRFSLVNPNAERVYEQDATIDWNVGIYLQRFTLRIDKLPISMLGLHWFVIEQRKEGKGKKASRWTVEGRVPLLISKPMEPDRAST